MAEKRYLGNIGPATVHLVRPPKQSPGRYLNQEQLLENRVLARNRIVIENFFGRLTGKFDVMGRPGAFAKAVFPRVFEIRCSRVNVDDPGQAFCGGT
jgi:hypothetical protein